MITTRSTSRRLTHPDLQPPAGTVLTAQERAARRQAEQARAEVRLSRWHRIQAANDAVDEYLRTSGTRSYQTAFAYIQSTRPELFADVQVPAWEVAAASRTSLAGGASAPVVANDGNKGGDPYHDALGRFTTREGAVGTGGGRHLPAVGVFDVSQPHAPRQGADDAEANQTPKTTEPPYKLIYRVTPGAFGQKVKTSECPAAVVQEAVAQFAKLRTASDEPVPVGVDNTMRAIKSYLNTAHRKTYREDIDFSGYDPNKGATIGDARAVLREQFNVSSQRIRIDQIAESLRRGPILVAISEDGSIDHGHAELILGMAGPHSYHVYNPLKSVQQAGTVEESKIIIYKDKDEDQGFPLVYALRPLTREEAKQPPTAAPASSPSTRAARRQSP